MTIEDVSTVDLATIVAGLVREGVQFRVNLTLKGDWTITLTGGFYDMARANIRRNYRKIDIYRKIPYGLVYLCSTTWSPNLKAARENYAAANPGEAAASDLVARYAEER